MQVLLIIQRHPIGTPCIWVGYKIDLLNGVIAIPSNKLQKLKDKLKVAKISSSMKAKDIASNIGRIISMSLAIGPICRLRTRKLYSLLHNRTSQY